MKLATLAAAAIGALTLGIAAQAEATTVDFRFLENATTVASGSFSYGDAETGVLGYGDLTSFDVTLEGVTYDLADVASLPLGRYFAYDTSAIAFVPSAGDSETIAAIASTVDSGFFFSGLTAGNFFEYTTNKGGGFNAIDIGVAAAPEPSVWALMIAGVGLTGLALRKSPRPSLA